MSILGGYRQAQDKIGAALGDEGARLRLASAGVHFTKLTPVTSTYSRAAARGASPVAAIAGQGRYGQYGVDVGQHQDQFRHFAGMTYSIIRTIANRIAGQTLHHARRVPDKLPERRRLGKAFVPRHLRSVAENLDTFTDSDILRAFRNPNPGMVQHTLTFNTISSLELTGKGYWWIRYEQDDDDHDGVGGEPQIWYLPAHWVEPVHTAKKLYAKWIIRPGGSGESFEVGPEEMVYFYYPDPSDPLQAYSPLVAMAKTVMADESIEESVRRSFLNAVAPSFAITIGAPAEAGATGVAMPPPVLTRHQRKALKTILLEEYRGTLNTGMPLILDGFIKAIQNLNTPPREFDFLNSAQATEARLCKGWGINPIVMGHVEGANRASSAVADDHFCRNVINPRLVMMSQTASCVMPQFFGGRRDEVVFFEPATSQDLDYELQLEEAMVSRGAMSNNEWRARHGMPRIQGGDAANIGNSGDGWVVVEHEEQEPEAHEEAEADTESAPPAKPAQPGSVGGFFVKGSVAERLGLKGVMERHDKLGEVYETKLRETTAAVLGGLAADFRERVGRMNPEHVDAMHARSAIDDGMWENALRGALSPVITEAALAGATQEWLLAQSFETARRLALGEKGWLPGGLKARVMRAVRAVLDGEIFRRMITHVRERVTRAVEKAEAADLSPALAATAAVASEESIAYQASRIAQMEAQSAVGVGQSAAYNMLHRAGKVSRRMWKSRRDERVRPTHDEADGQIAEGMGGFLVGGHSCMYPGDTTLPPGERYGCRCIAITLE